VTSEQTRSGSSPSRCKSSIGNWNPLPSEHDPISQRVSFINTLKRGRKCSERRYDCEGCVCNRYHVFLKPKYEKDAVRVANESQNNHQNELKYPALFDHLMRLVNLVSWRTLLCPGVGRLSTFIPTPKRKNMLIAGETKPNQTAGPLFSARYTLKLIDTFSCYRIKPYGWMTVNRSMVEPFPRKYWFKK
jgi:hypothetical protein